MPDDETGQDQADEVEKFLDSVGGEKPQQNEPEESDEVTPVEETEDGKTLEEAAEEAEPVVAEEDTPPAEETGPQVRLYTVPDSEVYGSLRGQKVTAAQLEEAGLIDKVITRDHQEMHNTKLYNELKRELAQTRQDLTPKEKPPEPIDPRTFGDEIERTYVPALKKLADAGSFEPDIVEAYPRFVGHVAHQLETMRMVGAGLVKAVEEMKDWAGTQQNTTAYERGMAALNSSMERLASNDLYASLRDPGERTAFIDWMKDANNPQPWKKMNIEEELARPENLSGAYAAYRAANPGVRTAPAAPADRTRARMAAPSGGNARTPKSNEPVNEFEQLKDELIKSRAAAFGR
ncbi:MAG TPA: hypothetical protein VMW79_07830 [Anaerolineae bacterium]|nr:hypothetical protein [Anaerolineae bacterium]